MRRELEQPYISFLNNLLADAVLKIQHAEDGTGCFVVKHVLNLLFYGGHINENLGKLSLHYKDWNFKEGQIY